jgi:hypothetical protein
VQTSRHTQECQNRWLGIAELDEITVQAKSLKLSEWRVPQLREDKELFSNGFD